jgi:hypothetical protein
MKDVMAWQKAGSSDEQFCRPILRTGFLPLLVPGKAGK